MFDATTSSTPPKSFKTPVESAKTVDDANITDYDIDWAKLDNGYVIIVYVAKGLFVLKQDGNEYNLWLQNQEYSDFPSEYLINAKVVKSSLVTQKFYAIYTSIRGSKYRVGVANFKDWLILDLSLSRELPLSDLTQKPYIALHPLSTNVSERSSNFFGNGLTSPNEFDDFWLYSEPNVVSTFQNFKIFLVKTTFISNSLSMQTTS
jgi:hypothetical protein